MTTLEDEHAIHLLGATEWHEDLSSSDLTFEAHDRGSSKTALYLFESARHSEM